MIVYSILGARPQFVKAAVVERALREVGIRCDMIHTGQHFDERMSSVFFDELGIAEPAVNLGIPGGRHGVSTGAMLAAVEDVIIRGKPDAVMVYGDTNSTLAAALASAKLHVPVLHVEAGLRSFNRKMPEEVNRVLTDHLSTLLFCPTHDAVRCLGVEGITAGVYHVGDVMYDTALLFGGMAMQKSQIVQKLGLGEREYALVTVHRAENTDYPERLKGIASALEQLSTTMPVVFPLHPRTKKMLEEYGIELKLQKGGITEPVGFLDMVRLEKSAGLILTDSGGVQKEAYFHGVPCVTMRDETEWVETVAAGWNTIVGADCERILAAARDARTGSEITEYGNGDSSGLIAAKVKEWHEQRR